MKAPANLQGQSLVPMLKDPTVAGRGWALTQVVRGGGSKARRREPGGEGDGKRFFGYSLRTPRWRYTEWDEGAQGRELYDHDADPQGTDQSRRTTRRTRRRSTNFPPNSAPPRKAPFPPSGEDT